MSRRNCPAVLFFVFALIAAFAANAQTPGCERTITARVVALDQPFFINRLGASMPEGMVYALERDVVSTNGKPELVQGEVALRPGKRPRPIVLRANVGDCIDIYFTNLLSKFPATNQNPAVQPATRYASVHVAGMEVVRTIDDDGSYAGTNPNSLVGPGQSKDYLIRATKEGTFLLNSMGAPFGGFNQPNDGAQVSAGLFGAVNVEPRGAEWYRSQITHDELELAIDKTKGSGGFSPLGQPYLNYDAVDGNGVPVLKMLDDKNRLIYTDLTAVITGPHHGKFVNPPPGDPSLNPVNIEPNRLDPYREFTIEYHELNDMVQAFPVFNYTSTDGVGLPPSTTFDGVNVNQNINATLQASGDAFAINYGTGGIGAEILANRFGLGPMNSCADCKFEEFFLSAWPVGDPAELVDYPANTPCGNLTNDKNVNQAPWTTQIDPLTGKKWPAKPPCTVGVIGNAPKNITPVRKATKVFFPDDPSNVYHSYINDRVIFRVLHSGTGVSHVHHLHAHQWVHSPNSDGSAYLDSQLINPGSAYTMEIAFNGSGNRNKVVGDSIFHCHFYPHFAAGMWAMWRSHDVYEVGSPFTKGSSQLMKYASRALPDGEIAAGTPIPAIVPMPVLAMPPMPAAVKVVAVADPNNPAGSPVGYRAEVDAGDLAKGINPGFPFFIPGVAGSRAPHPPLDFAVDNGKELDGGLPRHILLNATVTNEKHTTLDFSKDLSHVNAYRLPEDGTQEEKVAMKFHSTCLHDSFTPETTPAKFRTNGLPPAHGAPYSDPGLVPYPANDPPSGNDQCKPITDWINYRAAVIQTDFVLNKKGWHYPQARFLTLWEDVLPTFNNKRPAEPFFIRANSGQGVDYWHTDLVPSYFALDDFEVRTPTDIIGQHIHLVKFDVTASDGAANGYNYEDGTLAYDEVRHLIGDINECGGLAQSLGTLEKCGTGAGRMQLKATAPPKEICPDTNSKPCSDWFGAQTTVQRWFADPIPHENMNGTRTLRSVFTHDHFGPSTHQQTGLYAALLVEPTGSSWSMSDTGAPLHTRPDGGPTTWNAVIETKGDDKNTYREFAMEMQDFSLAYRKDSPSNENLDPDKGWASPKTAVEPNGLNINSTPPTLALSPQIISAGPTQGTTSFNYRNEPLPYRVFPSADNLGPSTDLGYVFSSTVKRNDPDMDKQPSPGTAIGSSGFLYPPALTPGVEPRDPYTPLLRAYEGDHVQVRILAGAHMLPHAFTVGGMKWLFEPSFDDSGYRSTQELGISEHFEMIFYAPRSAPSADAAHNWSDFLYMPDASNQRHGIVDGTWGIFRAYKQNLSDLKPLPTNAVIKPLPPPTLASGYSCPPGAVRQISVIATTPSQPVIFNNRGSGPAGRFPTSAPGHPFGTRIINSFPMMYVTSDNTASSEPLIVRANSGDCIALSLKNAFDTNAGVFGITSTAAFDEAYVTCALNPTCTTPTNLITLRPSTQAGLTPALLSFDAMASTGLNVGFNPTETVAPGATRTYYWYAGQTSVDPAGNITGEPIELGGANLTPADPLEQDRHGLVGALIVEPKDTIACADTYDPRSGQKTYASATIYDGSDCNSPGKLRYREFALVTQDDLANVSWAAGQWSSGPPANVTLNAPEGTTSVGVNYRSEPMPYRFAANANGFYKSPDLWQAFSDGLVLTDPYTPIFTAARGTPTRFHLLHPGGSGDQQVLALHGHVWQELPYTGTSTSIGDNRLSQHLGARDNYGTNSAYQIVLPSAGGMNRVIGDYLWRTTPANFLQLGLWGLFRVGESGQDAVRVSSAEFSSGGNLSIYGTVSAFVDTAMNAKNGSMVGSVALSLVDPNGNATSLGNANVGAAGQWNFITQTTAIKGSGYTVTATSASGGKGASPVIIAVAPATPIVVPEVPSQGESRRFVDPPRPTTNQPAPPTPPKTLPAPPSGGTQ